MCCLKLASDKEADGQALRITERLFTASLELVDLISWESESSSTSETQFNAHLDVGSTIILRRCGRCSFFVRAFSVFRALTSVFDQFFRKKSNLTGTGNGCFGLL